MTTKRIAVAVAVGALVSVGCSNDRPDIGRDGAGGATPVETEAPERIDATGTGDDGIEPVTGDGDNTGIAASYDFTFADGLVLPANDVGYVYRANAPIDDDALAVVAKFFGVEPDAVVNWDKDAITEDSPTVGMGYTASDPLQSWSYFDSEASADLTECTVDTTGTDDSADATDGSADASDGNGDGAAPGATDSEVCASPDEPADGVPDEAGAEAKMSEMLSAIGVEPGSVEMATYADEFVATVDATELDADGVATGRSWSLGLGGGGAPYAASGPLAVPKPVGPYPLVDLDAATSRLGGGWAGVVQSEANTGDTGEAEDGMVETLPADKKPPTDGGGFRPPAAEPVHIVKVEPDRVWLWDANNDAWMVPAFRFLDAAGNRWSVPAIAEDLLSSPGSNGESAVEPQDPNQPAESAAPPTTAAPTTEDDVPQPTLPPDASDALTPLLGTATLAEFSATADSFGLVVRVSSIDGAPQVLTLDFSESRVNVAVDSAPDRKLDNAVVVSIDSIG